MVFSTTAASQPCVKALLSLTGPALSEVEWDNMLKIRSKNDVTIVRFETEILAQPQPPKALMLFGKTLTG
jgi:hypothetical protein